MPRWRWASAWAASSAGYLSGGKIEYGLVPLGALGLSLSPRCSACPACRSGVVRLARAAGFFRRLFHRARVRAAATPVRPGGQKGEVQATANWLSFVGVFLASGTHWLLTQQLALSPRAFSWSAAC